MLTVTFSNQCHTKIPFCYRLIKNDFVEFCSINKGIATTVPIITYRL